MTQQRVIKALEVHGSPNLHDNKPLVFDEDDGGISLHWYNEDATVVIDIDGDGNISAYKNVGVVDEIDCPTEESLKTVAGWLSLLFKRAK